MGDQTSYSYQLAALADTLQTGAEFLIDVEDSVANAELIDEVHRPGLALAQFLDQQFHPRLPLLPNLRFPRLERRIGPGRGGDR